MARTTTRAQHRPPRPRPPVARTLPPPLALPRYPVPARLPAFGARATPALIGIVGVVLVVLGPLVLGVVLVVVALAALAANRVLGSPARLLAEIGGRRADPVSDARLVNVVEGLCVANGIEQPELRVREDASANAIVLGTGERDAVLVCTTGLLDLLDRMEIEGVVAHELAHLKRGDTAIAAVATEALGILGALGWFGTGLVVRLCGPAREACADLDGVAMTRYPPALAAGLEKLAATATSPSGLSGRVRRLTAPLWCVPLPEAGLGRAHPGVLDLEARVAALAEL